MHNMTQEDRIDFRAYERDLFRMVFRHTHVRHHDKNEYSCNLFDIKKKNEGQCWRANTNASNVMILLKWWESTEGLRAYHSIGFTSNS